MCDKNWGKRELIKLTNCEKLFACSLFIKFFVSYPD